MSRRVVWTKRAARELGDVDQNTARRIGRAVTRFAETGHGDIVLLAGPEREWRLRVGDWRVRFRFDDDAQAIVITRVLPRKDAYQT